MQPCRQTLFELEPRDFIEAKHGHALEIFLLNRLKRGVRVTRRLASQTRLLLPNMIAHLSAAFFLPWFLDSDLARALAVRSPSRSGGPKSVGSNSGKI
jgi:hypothetical protein